MDEPIVSRVSAGQCSMTIRAIAGSFGKGAWSMTRRIASPAAWSRLFHAAVQSSGAALAIRLVTASAKTDGEAVIVTVAERVAS